MKLKSLIFILFPFCLFGQVYIDQVIYSHPVNCTGSVTLKAIDNNLNAFNFLWNTGSTASTLSNVCPGLYNCLATPTDTSECVQQVEAIVYASPCIPVNEQLVVAIQEECGDGGNGSISIDTLQPGFNNNFIYDWDNGMNGASISNLSAGEYCVTINNSNIQYCEPYIECLIVTSDAQCDPGFEVQNNENEQYESEEIILNSDSEYQSAIKSFPNPFHDEIFVLVDSKLGIDEFDISVYNLSAPKYSFVETNLISGLNHTLSFPKKYPSGVYLMSFSNKEGVFHNKRIVRIQK